MAAPPEVGAVRPTMTRSVVDLPAPLGPRKPVTRPGPATKEMSSTAVNSPYFLVRDSTVIMSGSLAPEGHAAHQGMCWFDPRLYPGAPLGVDHEPVGGGVSHMWAQVPERGHAEPGCRVRSPLRRPSPRRAASSRRRARTD